MEGYARPNNPRHEPLSSICLFLYLEMLNYTYHKMILNHFVYRKRSPSLHLKKRAVKALFLFLYYFYPSVSVDFYRGGLFSQ